MKIKLISTILFGILISQASLSSASVPWGIGQTFPYVTTITQTSAVEQNNENGLTFAGLLNTEFQRDYKINNIDKINLLVSFDILDTIDGMAENFTTSYNSTEFGISLGFFTANYLQFENNNSFYLRSFNHPNWIPKLIEPDFKDINDNFKEQLNASEVVDNYMDWDDSKLYEFTLGNLLNNMTSWNINGGTSISDIKAAISDETTEYTMEFDLSGLLTTSYTDVINAEVVIIYVVYDVATISLNWAYDVDGILQQFSENEVYSYEKNDATFTYAYQTIINLSGGLSLDAIANLIQASSVIYLGIIGLLVIIIIYLIYKRK